MATALAVPLFSPNNQPLIPSKHTPTVHVCTSTRSPSSFSVRAQGGHEGGKVQRVWRRRKLNREDRKPEGKRILFLEEQVNKIKSEDKHICADIDRLLLSAGSRYEFVNEMIAEAKVLEAENEGSYGHKKVVLHAITNRIKDMGFPVAEAYMEPRPYKLQPEPTIAKKKF